MVANLDQRPLSAVSPWIKLLLLSCLVLQIFWHDHHKRLVIRSEPLPTAPSIQILEVLSFGEPEVLSRILTLWLQAFDNQSGVSLPFTHLDYAELTGWLQVISDLDPDSQYPFFSASYLYSQVDNRSQQIQILNFIRHNFLLKPNHRWRWMAHATLFARHRLNDLALATKYAALLRKKANGKNVPHWAQQMEITLLEAQGEYQSARLFIGGLLDNEQITDPHELYFLNQRLKSLREKSVNGKLH